MYIDYLSRSYRPAMPAAESEVWLAGVAPRPNACPRATMSLGLGIRRMVPWIPLQIFICVGAKSAARWACQIKGTQHAKRHHISGSLKLTTVAMVDWNFGFLAFYNPVQVGHDSPFCLVRTL